MKRGEGEEGKKRSRRRGEGGQEKKSNPNSDSSVFKSILLAS